MLIVVHWCRRRVCDQSSPDIVAPKRECCCATRHYHSRAISPFRSRRTRRFANRIKSRGRSWLISAVVRNGSPIWPSGHHRRALSLRLYVGAEHRSEPPHLHDAEGGPGLSRRDCRRPGRTSVLGFGRNAGDRGYLSGAGSRLDHATRRPLPQAAPASGRGTRGDVSALHVGRCSQFGRAHCPSDAVNSGKSASEYVY